MIIIHNREKKFIHNCMKKCGCLYNVYCIYCKFQVVLQGHSPSHWTVALAHCSALHELEYVLPAPEVKAGPAS